MIRVLLVSDTHVGSCMGLAPKKMIHEGMMILPNRHQKELHKAWCTMVKEIGDVDVCILNGDAIDGPQRLEEGKYVVTTDFMAQADWAAELLNMIPAKKFYLTKGTEYHSIKGMCAEQYIADVLRNKYGRKAQFRLELKVKIGWANMVANHTVGVSTSWYRATAITRDLTMYDLNKEEYGNIDVAIRSHAHYFILVDTGSKIGIVTPCWQLRTPFASKKDIVSPPKIGYVVLEISDEETHTIDVRKRFFKITPILEDEVYDEDS